MSNPFIDNLTCDFVRDLTPYESARRLFSGGNDWLNANESPFSNQFSLDTQRFNRYPDCQPESVLKAYADYAGLNKEQVLVSRGADEGIELLVRGFCNPGKDSILICPPTYGMYAISAQTFNVSVQRAPLNEDFSLDLAALEAVAASDKVPKLVFLCSPNNPTGSLIEQEQINAVLDMFAGKSLVVVDEAYIEFSPQYNQTALLAANPHVVILRTLSKAFALAGIRCGFTLACNDIIKVLLKVIAPYPVSAPVAQIAHQALSENGVQLMHKQVNYLQAEQAWLKQQIATQPSMALQGNDKANFLLYRCQHKDALMQHLVKNGVLIRDQSKQILLQDCLRITIGNREQNQRLLTLIKQFYQEGQVA